MTISCYSFFLLRFVPDIARGEAANLGVIVVDDAAGEMASAFLPDFGSKIRALAPGVSVAGIAATVEQFRRQLGGRRNELDDEQIRSSAQVTVLAGAMRNQLQLSEPKPFRAASLSEAARQLYDELVRPVGATSRAAEAGATAT